MSGLSDETIKSNLSRQGISLGDQAEAFRRIKGVKPKTKMRDMERKAVSKVSKVRKKMSDDEAKRSLAKEGFSGLDIEDALKATSYLKD